MPIYTKKGDQGKTSTLSHQQIEKSDLRAKALGTIDELNSGIGFLRSQIENSLYAEKQELSDQLLQVQKTLMSISSEVAGADSVLLSPKATTGLEKTIDHYQENLPELKYFIIPDGTAEVTYCHVVRTVCRRTERTLTELNSQDLLNPAVLSYLNRLSDLLFVICRELSISQGGGDKVWLVEQKEG